MRVPATAPLVLGILTLTLTLGLAGAARAQNAFLRSNLVSNLAGRASQTDSSLVNPWGILVGPGGRLWVADNGTGSLTSYDRAGHRVGPAVTLPPPGGAAPTGFVFSGGARGDRDGRFDDGRGGDESGEHGDHRGDGGGPAYVFATEDGTLLRWRPGCDSTLATMVASDSDAVFKGIALVDGGGGPVYLVTDFHQARVDVFDASFHRLDWAGAFRDTTIPDGFAPFGIQSVGDRVIVTYAAQDAEQHDDQQGPGLGYVDAFDRHGMLLRRLVSQGPLNAPWGIALAPRGFGGFGGALLVGNFGDGAIDAFDAMDGHFLGALEDTSGHPIAIDGLWGLAFGGSGDDGRDGAVPASGSGDDDRGGARATLFFAAGLDHEADGLVGALTAALPDTGHVVGRHPGHGAALRVALRGVNPVRLAAQPQVSFHVDAPGSSTVSLAVYDAMGRLVAQPAHASSIVDAGDVNWDGRDLRGARVPSGTYFYRASDGAQVASGRLVIVH